MPRYAEGAAAEPPPISLRDAGRARDAGPSADDAGRPPGVARRDTPETTREAQAPSTGKTSRNSSVETSGEKPSASGAAQTAHRPEEAARTSGEAERTREQPERPHEQSEPEETRKNSHEGEVIHRSEAKDGDASRADEQPEPEAEVLRRTTGTDEEGRADGEEHEVGEGREKLSLLKQRGAPLDIYKKLPPGLPHIPKHGGRPLAPSDRRSFEQAFGHGLEHVNVHTSASADDAARQLGADAFTVGHDIYFNRDSYAPGTPHGDRVLAHELTHVVQHDEGRMPRASGSKDAVSRPTDPLEVEAYAQEGAVARDVSVMRGGDVATPDAAPATDAAPPSVAPASAPSATPSNASSASSNASSAATSIALRDAADAGSAKAAPGVQPDSGSNGKPAGPSDDELIPPVPEQPSPLEQNASATPPAPADAAPPPAPPEAAPPAKAAAPAAAGTQPQPPPAPGVAPEIEPPETETVWVTAPLDLGGAQPAAGPPDAPAAVPSSSATEAQAPSTTAEAAAESSDDSAAREGDSGVAAARATAIEAEAESLTGQLEAAGADSLEAIDAQVAQMTESVHAEAESARARVVAVYEEQRASLSAQLEATLGAINQSRDQQHEAINGFTESERERLRATKQTQADDATVLAEQLRDAALATGDSEAERAVAGSEERAQTILAEADAAGAGGEPAQVEAQRKAAHDIAEDTAEKCRNTGEDLASKVREEASLQSEKYDELLQQFLDTLEETLTEAESKIDEFGDNATQLVASRAEQSLNAAREMASQSDAALENSQASAEEQIEAWEEQATTTLDAAASRLREQLSPQVEQLRPTFAGYGAEAAANLRALGGASADEVEETAAGALDALREAYGDMAGAFAEFDANTGTQLSGLFEELRANLAATIDERAAAAADTGTRMVQMLSDTAQTAATAMQEAVSSYQQQLSAGVDDSIAEMTRTGDDFRTRTQQGHDEATAKLAQLVDDGLTSEDNLLTDARTEMASAIARIAAEYQTLTREAEQRSASATEAPATRIHRGLWGDFWDWAGGLVDRVRKWFADTFGEFLGGLIFGILAALVMVVVGLLIGWVVGLIAAALEISAIVAVVVLLVAAVGLNIYNRFQEFYADHPGEDAGFWRGLGLVGLGIADLTGIPFIIEGIVGTRAFSPHPMTPFERGERLGMGIVFFGAAIISAKNLLRARPRVPLEPQIDPETGKVKVPPVPSPTQPMADVMKWGKGIPGIPETRARIGTLTLDELVRGGVTKQLAEQWRDFYRAAAARDPFDPATGRGNPQAQPRAELMQRAVDLLQNAQPAPVTPVPVRPPQPGDEDDGGRH
jgi:hypothetical protein